VATKFGAESASARIAARKAKEAFDASIAAELEQKRRMNAATYQKFREDLISKDVERILQESTAKALKDQETKLALQDYSSLDRRYHLEHFKKQLRDNEQIFREAARKKAEEKYIQGTENTPGARASRRSGLL
jgi:hypothetical protein